MSGLSGDEELKVPRCLTLEQAHGMRKDKEINEVNEKLKDTLTILKQKHLVRVKLKDLHTYQIQKRKKISDVGTMILRRMIEVCAWKFPNLMEA